MLHLMSGELRVVVMTAEQSPEDDANGVVLPPDAWDTREFAVRDYADGLGSWNWSDTQWFPGSIVNTAAALLTGYGTWFWAQEASSTVPDRDTWYESRYVHPYTGVVELKQARLVGFTDRQARRIYDRWMRRPDHTSCRELRARAAVTRDVRRAVPVPPVPVPPVPAVPTVPVPTVPVTVPERTPERANTAVAATVRVNVISPGNALVTGPEFTARVVQDPARPNGFTLLTEGGQYIGRVKSYPDAARRAAKHFGMPLTAADGVTVEYE